MQIDLNADLGEGVGNDAAMMQIVTSANVACGGHAGDRETMRRTLELARDAGVSVGAHPGYVDQEGFGRRIIPMSHDDIGRMCADQIETLQDIAAQVGVQLAYVKPHGALGNLAATDRAVADAIVTATRALDPRLAMLAISGTKAEDAARAAGSSVYSEIFADRGYLSTGQLVPRGQDGAMIHDASVATDRLLQFLDTGQMPVIDGDPIPLNAQSICVHGDGPQAVAMATEIRARLQAEGVAVQSFLAD